MAGTESGAKMSIWKAHGLLGHGDKESTCQTAKELGWVITRGSLMPYLHCAKSKAKQKNVSESSSAEKATKPGKHIYLDLSKVTVLKSDDQEFKLGNKNWKILVNEATGKKWSDLLQPRTECLRGLVSSYTSSSLVEFRCDAFDWIQLEKI